MRKPNRNKAEDDRFDALHIDDAKNKAIKIKKKVDLTLSDIEKIRLEMTHHLYALEEKIGEGGYATVFRLTNTKYSNKNEQVFALKVFNRNDENPTRINQSFEAECAALHRLNYPNIIKLYDNFSTSEYHFLVLEYCPFGSLKDHPCVSEIGQFKSIALTILNTVKFCHDKGFAHCDIKPNNFLVDQYGRVLLSDFGLALNVKEQGNCQQKSTRFGGSKPFIAPEICSHTPYDPLKADIWSLAVTFFYLATKRFPWSCSNDQNAVKKEILSGVIQFPSDLDTKIGWFLTSMFVLNPDSRPNINQVLTNEFLNDVSVGANILKRFPSRTTSSNDNKKTKTLTGNEPASFKNQELLPSPQRLSTVLTKVPLISGERMSYCKNKRHSAPKLTFTNPI